MGVVRQQEFWPKDREKKLRELWPTGISASEIGSQLGGITRNAVLGKAYRIGLPKRKAENFIRKRHTPANGHMWRRCRRTKRNVSSEAGGIFDVRSLATGGENIESTVTACDPHPGERVSLIDLKSTQCRWPFGDPREASFACCGRQCGYHQSYCDEHAKRASSGITAAQAHEQNVAKAHQ